MVYPNHNSARLKAASAIIGSVEQTRPSLFRLLCAEPKRRRASYLVDEAKRVVEILALEIGVEGQDAWQVLLRR